MKTLMLATFIVLVSVSVYAGEKEKIEKENMFLTKQEGNQLLYLDTKNITHYPNNISSIWMISLFVKGGELYNKVRESFQGKDPLFARSNMDFDCTNLRMAVISTTFYDKDGKMIGKNEPQRKWNPVRLKDAIDKKIYDTVCK